MFKSHTNGKIRCVEVIVVMTWLSDLHAGTCSKDLRIEETSVKHGGTGMMTHH